MTKPKPLGQPHQRLLALLTENKAGMKTPELAELGGVDVLNSLVRVLRRRGHEIERTESRWSCYSRWCLAENLEHAQRVHDAEHADGKAKAELKRKARDCAAYRSLLPSWEQRKRRAQEAGKARRQKRRILQEVGQMDDGATLPDCWPRPVASVWELAQTC